jgi:hypothetical protein
MFSTDSREEVDEEREDVEGKNEGNGPFEDGGSVVTFEFGADAECDGQGDFD